ncbi:MAG: hemolysin III family protein [Gaiellales bacterium]|nr:hemolysin III family protein [Gaiellales bacterium]
MRPRRRYSLGEEIASSVIHGLGAGMSVAALVLLVVQAAGSGDGWRLAAALIYSISLLLEFFASTMYHSLPQPRAKHVFRVLDHAGIYLLIAGTYTPFMLVTLRGVGYFWLFFAVWGCAVAGIVAEAFWTHRPAWVSVVVYLVMGWLVLFAIGPLVSRLGAGGVWLLAAGGLAYTLGSLFYLLKRIPWMHAVWHLFVVGGAVCHFLSVALFVI